MQKPIFVVPLDLGTIATGNEAAGFPAANLNRHDAIGLAWKSSGASNVWARGDFGSNKVVSFMAMIAANAGSGTQYRLRLGASQAEVDSGGNVIAQPNDIGHASWTKTGGAAATSNATTAPDGSTTASQLTGIGAGTIYTTASLTSATPEVKVWVKRISTTGVLRIASPLAYADGQWELNMASLGSGWELLTATHPAVTVVNAFKSTGASIGMRFEAVSGGPLSFYAWDAFISGTTITYDSGALPFISPSITREDGLYHSHLELPSEVTARWWRVDITGHTGDFQAGDLVLGKKIQPSRFFNYDWEFGVEDLGSVDLGRWGVFNVEPGSIWRTIDFTLAWQTEAEFETYFRPMAEKLGKRGIIYCCFDPQSSTYRQARTYMGVFKKALFAKGVRKPGTFSQEFSILSFI